MDWLRTIDSDALEDIVNDLLESGNKLENYRDALERVLTQWRQRLEKRGITTVENVGKRNMASYAQYLARRIDAGKSREVDGGISATTAWTYYDYVSAFLSYCVRWEYLEENPAQKGIATDELPPRPKKKSGDQQFWSAEDRKALVQYADRRAYEAVDEKGFDAIEELRDRAPVYVLAYSVVRGSEVLSDPRDDRRNGPRWTDVDLENNQLILGKNQQREDVQLPPLAHTPLERLEKALEPTSPEWPVFVTSHAPSLYSTLPDDADTSAGEPSSYSGNTAWFRRRSRRTAAGLS